MNASLTSIDSSDVDAHTVNGVLKTQCPKMFDRTWQSITLRSTADVFTHLLPFTLYTLCGRNIIHT